MIGSFLAWMLAGAAILMALTALWQVILPLAGIAFAIYAVIWGAATIVLKVTTRINDGYDKHQQIAARADAQHRKLMAGDDVAGVYGEYLPSKEFLPQSPPKNYKRGAEKSGMPKPKTKSKIATTWGGEVIKEIR